MDDATFLSTVNAESPVTVSELNSYIKSLIDGDPFLSRVTVKGEISNFVHHRTGHLYFSVKDEGSLIRAVMFRTSAAKLTFAPENGMKVILRGTVSAFVRDGQYQLYVTSMEPDGVGALYLAFEKLKKKLSAEGLFLAENKKPLPKIPSRIGIITSPTGAAVRDIIQVLGRRFPHAQVFLFPALVQGTEAPKTLIAGLDFFNRERNVDVIIMGRGGGSIEDLWAFNDEALARAVFHSAIPVISAVGHEIDFTICDFVADMRAPTPSAAAELAVPETEELKRRISNIVGRMQLLLSRTVDRRRQTIKMLHARRVFMQPETLLNERRISLDLLDDALRRAFEKRLLSLRTSFDVAVGKLNALSPLAVLSRGFAIPEKNGKLLRSIREVGIGDAISLKLEDGDVFATVNATKEKQIGDYL